MRVILSVCLFFTFATAIAASETRDFPLGDLAVRYDPAQWRFERVAEGDPLRAKPDVFRAACVACRGDGFVTISVADITREESEAVLDPMWARNRTETTMTVGELSFGVTTIHSPCRNYVPPSTTARVAYKGKTYSFRSGAIVGCRGATGVDSQRFEALLRGLHPRD